MRECKQDQQVAAIAGWLRQESLNTGYFSIRAINSLLLALLINKIISGDCIFTERGG